MSSLKVEVVTIDRVERHPNADRLDLVGVKGWNCVAGRTDPASPVALTLRRRNTKLAIRRYICRLIPCCRRSWKSTCFRLIQDQARKEPREIDQDPQGIVTRYGH